jgi:hypothetical protein
MPGLLPESPTGGPTTPNGGPITPLGPPELGALSSLGAPEDDDPTDADYSTDYSTPTPVPTDDDASFGPPDDDALLGPADASSAALGAVLTDAPQVDLELDPELAQLLSTPSPPATDAAAAEPSFDPYSCTANAGGPWASYFCGQPESAATNSSTGGPPVDPSTGLYRPYMQPLDTSKMIASTDVGFDPGFDPGAIIPPGARWVATVDFDTAGPSDGLPPGQYDEYVVTVQDGAAQYSYVKYVPVQPGVVTVDQVEIQGVTWLDTVVMPGQLPAPATPATTATDPSAPPIAQAQPSPAPPPPPPPPPAMPPATPPTPAAMAPQVAPGIGGDAVAAQPAASPLPTPQAAPPVAYDPMADSWLQHVPDFLTNDANLRLAQLTFGVVGVAFATVATGGFAGELSAGLLGGGTTVGAGSAGAMSLGTAMLSGAAGTVAGGATVRYGTDWIAAQAGARVSQADAYRDAFDPQAMVTDADLGMLSGLASYGAGVAGQKLAEWELSRRVNAGDILVPQTFVDRPPIPAIDNSEVTFDSRLQLPAIDNPEVTFFGRSKVPMNDNAALTFFDRSPLTANRNFGPSDLQPGAQATRMTKGYVGEEMTYADHPELTFLASHVTLYSPDGVEFTVDWLAQDQNGNLVAIESKFASGGPSGPQTRSGVFEGGGGWRQVVAVGNSAAKSGLPAMTPVWVYFILEKWDWPLN